MEKLADSYGIYLIVDSAESLGAKCINGRHAGSGGDASILSFNGNKIITTSGGGMLVTKHKEWAEKARFLATQAREPTPHYEHQTFGYNYRLSNICAAIGLGQMEVLDQRVARRREMFNNYQTELAFPGVTFMPEPEGFFSTRWLTTLTIEVVARTNRETIRRALLSTRLNLAHCGSQCICNRYMRERLITDAGTTIYCSTTDCACLQVAMTDLEQEEVIDRVKKR